jgi:hypothetical protein
VIAVRLVGSWLAVTVVILSRNRLSMISVSLCDARSTLLPAALRNRSLCRSASRERTAAYSRFVAA